MVVGVPVVSRRLLLHEYPQQGQGVQTSTYKLSSDVCFEDVLLIRVNHSKTVSQDSDESLWRDSDGGLVVTMVMCSVTGASFARIGLGAYRCVMLLSSDHSLNVTFSMITLF